MDPTYPLFPIFAFLGFFLSLVPLSWHLQAWNSGTCFYMIWTALACLNQFVNSVVWAGNALNPAPIWCDISIRITLGASVGIPAASLCINRRLYQIARVHAVTITHAEKRRAILIDSLICVLFPVIFIALQYIVQGHRFDIFEDIGCYPSIFNTPVSFVINSMWPIVLGLISAVYCVLSLRAFMHRRSQFNQFLTSNASLTVSRYFRLMALAMTEIACTTPLAIFAIYLNANAQTMQPYGSWENVHFNFSRVEQVPAVLWRMNHLFVISVEMSRWVAPLCAFIFFGFFGFAEEARRHYAMAFWAVLKRVGFRPRVTVHALPGYTGAMKKEAMLSSHNASACPPYDYSPDHPGSFSSISTDQSLRSDWKPTRSFPHMFSLPIGPPAVPQYADESLSRYIESLPTPTTATSSSFSDDRSHGRASMSAVASPPNSAAHSAFSPSRPQSLPCVLDRAVEPGLRSSFSSSSTLDASQPTPSSNHVDRR